MSNIQFLQADLFRHMLNNDFLNYVRIKNFESTEIKTDENTKSEHKRIRFEESKIQIASLCLIVMQHKNK